MALIFHLLIVGIVFFSAVDGTSEPLPTMIVEPEPPSCADPGRFRCANSGRCIPARWLCDGDNDCGDLSDEDTTTCLSYECADDQLRCTNGQCIDESRLCTVQGRGCSDGSLDASEICSSIRCPSPEQWMCPSGDRCISPSWLCDGDNDCLDNSDEQPETCEAYTCPPNTFQCETARRCVRETWICDGDNDCGDGSDERPEVCAERTCSSDQFQCENSGRCISTMWVCDDDNDCGDSSDERPENCYLNPLYCVRTIERTCMGSITAEIDDLDVAAILEKLVSTDLRETCSLIIEAQDCASAILQGECSQAVQQSVDFQQQIAAANETLNFICRQNVAVFNQYKECLLRPAPDGGLLLFKTIGQQCAYVGSLPDPCLLSSYIECAANIATAQCGEEITQYLRTLAAKVLTEFGCTAGKYRRGSVDVMKNRIRSIYKGSDKMMKKKTRNIYGTGKHLFLKNVLKAFI